MAAIGCGQEHAQSSVNDACSDGGAYERISVTDEACRAFTEAETRGQVVVDGSKAPAWTSPAAKVPAAPPPRFSWTKGVLAYWKPWQQWFLGEARAHGDTTGDAFVLTFRDKPAKSSIAR